tara:strand:- start:6875 stop:7429 length:555 start_codon:yes stop_codon:yes gene_type:complete
MPAQIIQLKKTLKGPKCLRSNLVFPALYRVSGYYFDLNDEGSIVASDTPAVVTYTLSGDDTPRISDPKVEPVQGLDSLGDTNGWVIVRHHTNEERAQGYLDAIIDLQGSRAFERVHQTIFRQGSAVYTLSHREPVPGKEGGIVVYITRLPFTNGPATGAMGDHWTIVTREGEVTEDIDRFYDEE